MEGTGPNQRCGKEPLELVPINKGERTQPLKYRPVSLTSVEKKIGEMVIKERQYTHTNNITAHSVPTPQKMVKLIAKCLSVCMHVYIVPVPILTNILIMPRL